MTQNPTPSALQALEKFVEDAYCGDYLALERKMAEIIYMLHYLPTEIFADSQAREAGYILNVFRESFRRAQEVKSSGRFS